MKIKSILGAALTIAIVISAAFAIKVYAATALAEPEEALKPSLFSAQYEDYLPEGWFTHTKLSANLTRSDAAYLALYTLSKASGTSVEWMDYKTDLTDSDDPILSRAVDMGLMSVGTDLKFEPNKTITNQEFAVIITKLVAKLGAYEKPSKALSYKDSTSIATWAKESVQYLQEKNWTMWITNNTFEPTKVMTYGRAIALSNELLADNNVYPAVKIVTIPSDKQYTIDGYKVPKPTLGLTEWDITANASNQLEMTFNGIIKNRGLNSYKSIQYQLISILDSNSEVSYDARSALQTTLKEHWDITTQSFSFDKKLFIRMENGQISTVAPNANAISIEAGNIIRIRLIK